MRILLVKPPSNMHLVVVPIGIGYIASYLKSKTHDVEIYFLDCLREKWGHDKFREYVAQLKPDLVGITAFTLEIESALTCCQIVKNINKNIITVIGGIHVTVAPEEALTNEQVDYIFQGEAEIGFCEFVRALQDGRDCKQVSNLGYKKNGNIHLNQMAYPENLDELPFPDYELLKFDEYPKTYKMKYYPSGALITSRGCPYSCTYCSAGKVSGKRFRFRSPENIIEEIAYLKERYGINEFEIWDDNFTLNRKRTHDFCDQLKAAHISLPWWCPNGLRLETLDEELIHKMRDAGLYSIAIGVESGSEKIQKDMKKNLDLQKVKDVFELGKKVGIRMEGFFILGYPTETKEDILKTIKFMKELPLKRASILLFQPLKGSEIYEDLKKQGKLKGVDLQAMDYSKPSVLPEGFDSLDELKKLQRKAILEFYLRPKVLTSFIIENFTKDQIIELWHMVMKYVFNK